MDYKNEEDNTSTEGLPLHQEDSTQIHVESSQETSGGIHMKKLMQRGREKEISNRRCRVYIVNKRKV
jgi:hypothetical protein